MLGQGTSGSWVRPRWDISGLIQVQRQKLSVHIGIFLETSKREGDRGNEGGSGLGDQVFLWVHVPMCITGQATAAMVPFPCRVTLLSLERMTALVMGSMSTLTSDIHTIVG